MTALATPETLWTITPEDLARAFNATSAGFLVQPDGSLRLPAFSRGFDEFRDWAPGRSPGMNYLVAFPEARYVADDPEWTVSVRIIRLTSDESLQQLMLAVAFANDPTFSMDITKENLPSLVARSLSPRPELLSERMLLSAFRAVGNIGVINAFYGDMLAATPGLRFRSISEPHKKFTGTWNGFPFRVKVSGRQARLNIWCANADAQHPAWHAHISYPEAKPLWEQIAGDAPTAVHRLFSDLVAKLEPTESAPVGVPMPPFTVNRLGR